MKNSFLKYFFNILSICLMLLFLDSCIREDEFTPPRTNNQSNISKPTISLLEVNALFDGKAIEFKNEADGKDIIISGYVVSSDQSNNITKLLFIQDNIVNPKSGIAIAIDADNINSIANIGKLISIKVNDFALDQEGGILKIGSLKDGVFNTLTKKEFEEATEIGNTSAITPLKINAKEYLNLKETSAGILVQLENMQLDKVIPGLQFTKSVGVSTIVNISDCSDNTIIPLKTFETADFEDDIFPEKQITVTGIITKLGLILRSLNDIKLNTNDRCNLIEPTANVTIQQVLDISERGGGFPFGTNSFEKKGIRPVVSGYVISSDAKSNIQNKLYFQDALENPTAGLSIDIDKENLYQTYEIGKKIYIDLTELAIVNSNNNLTLREYDSSGSTFALSTSSASFKNTVRVTLNQDLPQIVPLEVEVSAIQNKEVPFGVLIKLSDMELQVTDPPQLNTFDRNFKTFSNCTTGNTVTLESTTRNAIYLDSNIPAGIGSITAIKVNLSRSNKGIGILINSNENILLDSSTQCSK